MALLYGRGYGIVMTGYGGALRPSGVNTPKSGVT
jgi:hypothetical protein